MAAAGLRTGRADRPAGAAKRRGPVRGCLGGRRRRAPSQQPASRSASSQATSTATTTPICCSQPRHRARPAAQRRRQRQQRRSHRLARTERQPQRHRHEGRSAGWRGVAEVRDRERLRFRRPGVARDPRRHRQGHAGRCRPTALADRRRAGRGGAQGEHASRDHADRSPRQLVPGALLVEWRALRVHRRCHRAGGGRPLGRAEHTQHLRRRRTGEGRRPAGEGEGRTRVVPLRRADGGSDLPRSGEAVRGGSPRGHRGLPERVLRGDAAAPGRSPNRVTRRAPAGWRLGRSGARRDGRAERARPAFRRAHPSVVEAGLQPCIQLQGLRPPSRPRARPRRSSPMARPCGC